jgi:DNA polymerase III subunit gamma/tau
MIQSSDVAEAVSESIAAHTPAKRQVTPFPVASSQPKGFAESITEGALAKAPDTEPAQGAPDTDTLRQAVTTALATAEHLTASQLLAVGTWTLDGAGVRIEVAAMGKKMLSLTVNAAAEKIIRQELQKLGAPARFMIIPGAAGGPVAATEASAPVGSVQQVALGHPLVQRAKEIFHAEVVSVLDLRGK